MIHQNLIEDIEATNRHIIARNIRADRPTFDLSKQSYSLSLKRQGPKRKRITKFNDKELPDGVHPSITLEQIWAKYIAKVTIAILTKEERKETTSEDEEADPQPSGSWDFKRSRHQE